MSLFLLISPTHVNLVKYTYIYYKLGNNNNKYRMLLLIKS